MEPETQTQSKLTDPREDGELPVTRVASSTPAARATASSEPEVGFTVGEFQLLEELGRGAFGSVFLANQSELNRRVALKISGQASMTAEEGKSLGGLEHDHIVKVYSAFTHEPTGWHCLCLQYVPGADLKAVIERLNQAEARPQTGAELLAAIDAVGRRDEAFDPASLRDRDALAADNFAQAVCRMGGRLAEALAFAHAKGVLHCDIKPGNILISPYGRPLLADFNVAFDRERMGTAGGLGGTRNYMAPEYEAALKNHSPGGVDDRCDLYSLGVVLHELATGRRPGPDSLADLPRELSVVIRRCLERDPDRRYQSAAELSAALAGAWHLLAIRRSLPEPERISRHVIARPLTALAVASTLPHVVASLVNIGFNSQRVEMGSEQQRAFLLVMIAYNVIAYPIAFAIAVTLFRRVARPLQGIERAAGAEVDSLRSRVCRLGRQVAIIGALGWFPGGLLFPLMIDLVAGLQEGQRVPVYVHFLVSFTLSGLIAVVFSYLGVQYVAFRSLLPRLGNPDTFTPEDLAREVQPLVAPFGPLVLLASAIPLTGAVLQIAFTDGTMTLGFRVLMVALIGFGAFGVALAERLVKRISRLAAPWLSAAANSTARESRESWDRSRSGVYKKPAV